MHTGNQELVYLNTAGCGLISKTALAAGRDVYEAFSSNSSGRAEYWRDHEAGRIRKTVAAFTGATEEQVALIPNFSFGINSLVQALKGNEKVLLFRQDYPSLTQPFMINRFAISWIDTPDDFTISLTDIEKILRAEKINILAISHVQWLSGFKISLEKLGRLCRQYGVWLIIDATQSLGAAVIDLSALPVDVLIASNYKWMNAGFGNGIMYMTDAFLQQYTPVVGGHNSYREHNGQWGYVPSVRSYEPGSLDIFGLMVLEKAIEEKNTKGLEWIVQHNMQLTRQLITGLQQMPVRLIGEADVNNRTSIVFVKDEDGLGDWLQQHGIVVTARNGNLRISMHFHNTEKDVQALLDCMAEKYERR